MSEGPPRKAEPHSHDPVTAREPQLAEHVLRLIALGETLVSNGVMVVEDIRLKQDELKARGLAHGLPYFEVRFLGVKGVLIDKALITERELQREMDDLTTMEKERDHARTWLERGVMALTNLLVEKNIVDPDAFERRYGVVRARSPMMGARIVARAWMDPAFRARLKTDPKAAITAWDPSLTGSLRDAHLAVLENTEKLRNVVVCTLCSCYPRALLGEPPEWYTSDSYKHRVIKEPRTVLREMGTRLGDDVDLRVYDSTADMRYMVLPLRPTGTEGFSEEELARLVTRDSLIGVADCLTPEQK